MSSNHLQSFSNSKVVFSFLGEKPPLPRWEPAPDMHIFTRLVEEEGHIRSVKCPCKPHLESARGGQYIFVHIQLDGG